MYFIELSLQILREMRAHKVRSLLALFGIAWGTLTVILLLALGQGFYNAGQKSMASLATGTLRIWPNITAKAYQGQPPGQPLHLQTNAIMAMPKIIPAIRYISPLVTQQTNLQWHTQQSNAQVVGVTAEYNILSQLKTVPNGRFLNPLDVQQQKLVVYLGSKLAKQIFAAANPVGQYLLVNSIPFLVIGVEAKNTNNSNNFDWNADNAYIPYTTAIAMWGNIDISGFLVQPYDINQLNSFSNTIIHYLSNQYHFDPTDKSALYIFNPAHATQFISWFFHCIELFLGFCGVLTLGVGGIGVANIMFLIVTERTKEIGLRMAVGARPTDILLQVLLETGVIVLLGGCAGFLLALLSIAILQAITLPDWLGKPVTSAWLIFITIFILALTGLLAGYFPARRAANMQPVVALNY